MKRWVWIAAVALLLSGCGVQQTYETVMDVWQEQEIPEPRAISVELPGETALPVFENDQGRIYVCNDYEIVIQTLAAGDLEETFQTICGLPKENLTVVETKTDGMNRYEFVWAAAGEAGDQTGRGVVLDDGNYHYCMSALWDAGKASKVSWEDVFGSFTVQ
jgi:hypothetical protein